LTFAKSAFAFAFASASPNGFDAVTVAEDVILAAMTAPSRSRQLPSS
jgi:hypothetical protein